MTLRTDEQDDTRYLIPVAGAILAALQLGLFIWPSALNQTWRSSVDDFFLWAAVPATLACVVAVFLSFRRTESLRWTLFWSALGALIAFAVVFGGLYYEVWLEYQPGGRGYNPGLNP